MKKTVAICTAVLALGSNAAEVADAFVTEARQLYLTDEYSDCKKEAVSLFYKGADKPGWTNDFPSASGNDIVTWYRIGATVRNVRDIGGWTGLRMGRVYRGTQLSVCKKDQVHYIDEAGKDFMLNTLHIKTDLDFRHESVSGRGEYVYTSPLGPSVELVGAVIQSYTNIFVAGYKPALQKMMRTFADSTKYPIYMHCMGGADRTGSAAFILEGLCGVSEPDLRIDYELTSFSGQGSRKSYDATEDNWFQQMYAMMKAYPGSTWAEKIENYCKTFLELTDIEIAAIRANLVSTPGASFVYTEDTTVTDALALDTDVVIDVYPGVTVTYSGAISGSGRLIKVGDGTLVLSGANTATGSLEAGNGTIRLSSLLSATSKVVLEKGRVVCGVANALGGAKVVWTAPEGTLDVNGKDIGMLLGADSTPVLAKGATGYEVVNSTSTSADVIVTNEVEKTAVHVRFSGKIELKPYTKNMVLKNRRHDISAFAIGASMTVGEGTVIRGVTSIALNSGSRTLTISSAEPDCFAELKSITIGKSRLELNQTMLSEFSRRGNIALTVYSGRAADAGLKLPSANSRLYVRSFKDGSGNVLAPGVYNTTDYFLKVNQGYVVVEGGRDPMSAESVTWAGADSADLSVSANWTDSESQPLTADLTTPANCYAAQVTSGTAATLSKTVFFGGFQFGGALSGFTVGTEGDTEALRIDGTGITFATKDDTSVGRTFEFYCPVILNSSAALTIPEGDKLVFHSGASINANGVKVNGSGKLEFIGGTNFIEGAITNSASTIAVSGVLKGNGSITVPTTGSKFYLNGAEFNVPITSAENVTFDTESAADVTNIVRNFKTDATTKNLLRKDRVYLFEGISATGKFAFGVIGGNTSEGATVIVRDVKQSYRSDGYFTASESTRIILDSSEVGDCRRLLIYKPGGRIVFVRDNWFSATTAAKTSAGGIESDNAGLYDLTTTHQYCSWIEGPAPIDGDAGSVVEILCGTGQSFSGGFRGAASLIMNGAGTQTLTGKSTSTGELTVKQGELVLSSTANWNTSPVVKVLGGKLTLEGAGQLNGEVTKLVVDGDGVVNVAGLTYVASATIDGEPVGAGVYTVANPGPFAGHLEGAGSIKVGKTGMMLMMR